MHQLPRRKPRITICQSDYDRLSNLVVAYEQRNPEIADNLAAEIERARIVSDKAIANTVVRMGSTVTYTVDGAQSKTIVLVYPADARIEEGRIAITTPVGTALIGLKAGQTISYTTRNGQIHDLAVNEVSQIKQDALAG